MFNLNSTVLMSDADHFSNEAPINPYYKHESIDIGNAVNEHNEIKRCLLDAGMKIISVASPRNCQDGVYTANWALVRNGEAVMARLPNARKKEEDHAKKSLEELGIKTHILPDNLKFSGQGDALPCGNLLFCGSNYRSDEDAQKIAAEILGYERVQLQTIPKITKNGELEINQSSGWPDSYFYDIDLALAIIKNPTEQQKGLIAYCPDAFTGESKKILEDINSVDKIIVGFDEAKIAFATNLVSNGETVVMSAHAPELKAKLESIGMRVITPEISELAKGGGYIRCVTLTIS